MRYGNTQLSYRPGSLVFSHVKSVNIVHYPNTDTSDQVGLGRPATRIMCTLVAKNEEQRWTIEQLFHGNQEADLIVGDRRYKRVVTGGEPQEHEIKIGTTWEFTVEFIALDPVPYSVDTDELLW